MKSHERVFVALLLLVAMPVLPNAQSSGTQGFDQDRRVFEAADQGNLEKLLTALAAGGRADGYTDEVGRTALIVASFGGHYGHVEVLSKLLDSANVNHADKFDGTPLMVASSLGYARVVGKLLEKGARPDLQDKDGYTALFWAIRNNHSHVVDMLVDKSLAGANETLNLQDKYGNTGVALAALYGHHEIVSKLTARGADLHLRDRFGYSRFPGESDLQTSSSTTTSATTTTTPPPTTSSTTSPSPTSTTATTPRPTTSSTTSPPPTSGTENTTSALQESAASFSTTPAPAPAT
jgi:ankyrin repeat protein